MMSENHKNSGCGFGATLVSYLYGETDAAETVAFELHLNDCRMCAAELEAFSGVKFSINDWKSKEFDALETPVIAIPYPKQAEVSSEKGAWLPAFVRDLFSLSSRALMPAAATALVLVAVVGLALFFINSGKSDLVAGSNTKPQKSPTPPNENNKAEQTRENINVSTPNAPNKEPEKSFEPKSPKRAVVETNPPNNRAVKVFDNPAQKIENTPKNNEAKRVADKNKNKAAPKLTTDEDEEDDSLRLAELFEELDTKD